MPGGQRTDGGQRNACGPGRRCLHALGTPFRAVGQLKERTVKLICRGFEKYALFVYRFAWPVIIVSGLLAAVFGICVLFTVKLERDPEALYALPGSQALQDKAKLTELFGPPERVTAVILESNRREAGGEWWRREGLMSASFLGDAQTLHEEIMNITAVGPDGVTPVTFKDVCLLDGFGDCIVMSILDMYPQKWRYGRSLTTFEWPIVTNRRSQKAYKADALVGNFSLDVTEYDNSNFTRTTLVNATVSGLRFQYPI
eukprot:GHVU01205790.1.p1 GENE.GHVU01205790.1~~GHVU01205790.1.p1  ORF type:complete len:257 (+),score=41.10 GHVU01205790.1:483-1253(+)